MKTRNSVYFRFRMARFFTLVVSTLLILSTSSAVAQVDSLLNCLTQYEENDSSRISIYLQLSENFDGENEEAQMQYAIKALELSENLELPIYFIKSAESLTSIHYFKGEYVESKEYISKAVSVARANKMWPELGSALVTLGQIEDFLEEDQSSIDHTLEGIAILEDIKDYTEMIRGYNSLASFYYYREMNDKALEYYNLARALMINHLDIKENYELVAVTESNIGWVNYYDGKIDDAIVQFRKAIQIYDKYDKISTYAANARSSLSVMYSEIGMFFPAIQQAEESIEISEELGYFKGLYNGYEALGTAYRGKGEVNNAIESYEMAYAYADSLGFLEDMAYSSLKIAEIYESFNEYEEAYKYLLLNRELSDSLEMIRNEASFEEAITKYETEKTESQNQLLKKENELKKLELENQKIASDSEMEKQWTIGASVGIVLLLIMIFFIYQNRIKQKANSQLSEAYTTIQRSHAELKNANLIIQEKNDDITSSIEYASKIQEALLPTRENADLFRDSFFILRPKDIVSGDFLWYTKVEDSVIFAAADCTGHGVPGAFMSMIGNSFLQQIITESKIYQPALILDELRARVIDALNQKNGVDARKDGMDMALCNLNLKTGELQFSGANNPLYYVKEGQMIEIKGDKQPVGYMPERDEPFTNHTIQLSKGDALYVFSDGYADQFGGPKGKKFKYRQMRDLLFNNYQLEMSQQKQIMLKAFDDWKGDLEQIDDVCMIGVRI